MYKVGDKIVYPMHGAGVIESIEEKEILGLRQSYYVVRIPIGDMRVLIPTHNIEGIGIRGIIDIYEVDKVLAALHEQSTNENLSWNKRYRDNMVKIKSGNIFEIANVVKTLVIRERDKGLSAGEKKMLHSAKQILISELVLAINLDHLQIENIIDEHLKAQ